ncbi:hypothetical protein [Rossellomorea yichunensis]|nr:hypothetical protein [Rossellomorea sp. YC4-1]MDT9026521.1 hypothetical protein [Rossellomorea sp. YC4-1]
MNLTFLLKKRPRFDKKMTRFTILAGSYTISTNEAVKEASAK